MPTKKKSKLTTYCEQAQLTIGALAALAGVEQASPATMTAKGVLLPNSKIYAALRNLPDEDGPVLFGIKADQLTVAQLEEFLGMDGPATPDASLHMEYASRGRLIVVLGVLGNDPAAPTKPAWREFALPKALAFTEDSQGWDYWAYNFSSTVAVAANGLIDIQMVATIRWTE